MAPSTMSTFKKTSDKANLLDMAETGKAGRFTHHIVDESAATG